MLNIDKHYKTIFIETFVMSLGFSLASFSTFICYLMFKNLSNFFSTTIKKYIKKKQTQKKYITTETQTDDILQSGDNSDDILHSDKNLTIEYSEILSDTHNENTVEKDEININLEDNKNDIFTLYKLYNELKERIQTIECNISKDVRSLKMFNDTVELYFKSELENSKYDIANMKLELDTTKSSISSIHENIHNNITQIYDKLNYIHQQTDDYVFED